MTHRSLFTHLFICAALILAGACAHSEKATHPKPPPVDTDSLYARLGGAYGIAIVVDDLVDRAAANEVLLANPQIKDAFEEFPLPALKFQVTTQLCEAAGGPERYTGRDMKSAHMHLDIGEEEWRAFMQDVHATAAKFKIPEREAGELIAILESTKADIVTRAAP